MIPQISLCLLTWNEIQGCQQVIPNLPQNLVTEVFALDGGSTDGTVQYLSAAGITVVPQVKRSYNAAYIEAIDHYSGDGIVFYHPKGTVDEASLPLVHAELASGRDLVVASRMLPASKNEEDDQLIRHRKWFGQGLALAASLRWNRRGVARISDPLHGYRGCSRAFTDSLRLRPSGVTADLEMVQHAYASGASVAEIPVDESERQVGGTHFPAWKTGKALMRYLIMSS
jgi:glycosyltransferase involved in cell wall biosynthesis